MLCVHDQEIEKNCLTTFSHIRCCFQNKQLDLFRWEIALSRLIELCSLPNIQTIASWHNFTLQSIFSLSYKHIGVTRLPFHSMLSNKPRVYVQGLPIWRISPHQCPVGKLVIIETYFRLRSAWLPMETSGLLQPAYTSYSLGRILLQAAIPSAYLLIGL